MEIMLRKSNNIPVKLLGYARQRLGDLADTAKKISGKTSKGNI